MTTIYDLVRDGMAVEVMRLLDLEGSPPSAVYKAVDDLIDLYIDENDIDGVEDIVERVVRYENKFFARIKGETHRLTAKEAAPDTGEMLVDWAVEGPDKTDTHYRERFHGMRIKVPRFHVKLVDGYLEWKGGDTHRRNPQHTRQWLPSMVDEDEEDDKSPAERQQWEAKRFKHIPVVTVTPEEKNPRGVFTAKGERMYEDIKRGYRGDPRAAEIAARTVYARAAEGVPGLVRRGDR